MLEIQQSRGSTSLGFCAVLLDVWAAGHGQEQIVVEVADLHLLEVLNLLQTLIAWFQMRSMQSPVLSGVSGFGESKLQHNFTANVIWYGIISMSYTLDCIQGQHLTVQIQSAFNV